MIKSLKYRIYPTEQQEVLLLKTFGCVRFIYNHFLELRNTMYEESRKSISCFQMMSMLPKLKKEFPWLTEVCANALQQSLRHLDNAFTNFFKHNSRYPKFKSKKDKCSFTEPGGISIKDDKLFLPKFREGIKLKLHRPLDGDIRSATVSKNAANQYYVSIVVQVPDSQFLKTPIIPDTTIGIDLGIKDFAVLSTEERIKNPHYLKDSLRLLRRECRKLSKMQKGSNNYEKQQLKIAKIYQHITNQREDFLHKLTYKLTHDSQVSMICIEDLAVKELLEDKVMSRNIADVSWSKFRAFLAYKCQWYGINLLTIPRYAPSSKLCPVCGHINERLTLTDRTWKCPRCQTIHDRDLNAAQNIRRIGLEQFYRKCAESS